MIVSPTCSCCVKNVPVPTHRQRTITHGCTHRERIPPRTNAFTGIAVALTAAAPATTIWNVEPVPTIGVVPAGIAATGNAVTGSTKWTSPQGRPHGECRLQRRDVSRHCRERQRHGLVPVVGLRGRHRALNRHRPAHRPAEIVCHSKYSTAPTRQSFRRYLRVRRHDSTVVPPTVAQPARERQQTGPKFVCPDPPTDNPAVVDDVIGPLIVSASRSCSGFINPGNTLEVQPGARSSGAGADAPTPQLMIPLSPERWLPSH